jgi:hypothetical protein
VLGKARQPIDLVPNDDTGGDGTISQHLTLLQAVINGMPEFKTAFPETRRIVATTENQPKDPQGSEQP